MVSTGNSSTLAVVVSAVILLVGVFTLPKSSRAQSPSAGNVTLDGKRVAVTAWEPFGETASKQKWLSEALRIMVTRERSRIGEISVLSTDQYANRLSEANLSDVNPNDSQNARDIVEATGADIIFVGTYQIKNSRIQLSAVFYDPIAQQTFSAHSELGRLNQIKELETALVKRLLRKGGATLGTSELNWLDRDKELRTDELTFPSPTPKPGVLDREPEVVGVLPDVSDTAGLGVQRRNIMVSLHFPGVSIGYQPTRNTTTELRFSSNSDVSVISGRWTHHFFRFADSNLYWGLEAGHVDFVGDVSEGTGLVGGGFFGFEQYMTSNLSFKVDFGSFFTSLEDDETGVSESGLGFSVNAGVALHYF